MLPPDFPPAAPLDNVPTNYTYSYRGSFGIETRIRSALSAYARSDPRFWTYTVVVFVAAAAAGIVGAQQYPVAIPIIAFLMFVIVGPIVPMQILRQIAVVAGVYAVEGETYQTFFDETAFWWAVPGGSYRVDLHDVVRIYRTAGVTVVGLRGTRAICVLPDELLPTDIASKIRRSARANRRK
jgi:hypothetical protein